MVSTSALERIASLEQRFGDPFDTANPLGFSEVLDCDERGVAFEAGEDVLSEFGMNAELVPDELGGRFTRLDDLIGIAKVVSRRDPGLGAGRITGSLLAGVCVWQAGSEGQRRYVADTLLAGHRLACGYHELAHGNDVTAADCSARTSGNQLVLNGRKDVIANADHAKAMVLFAATDGPSPGRTGHSQLLLPHGDLTAEGVSVLPRYHTVGLRGVQLRGMSFDSARVDANRVLGELGRGAENTMKAFQLTRIALPAMMVSTVDTALRCTVRHLRDRTLYGRSAVELPHLKSKLVEIFVMLVAADAFATAAARSLHVYPGEGAVHAAAVKYSLPRLLTGAMDELAMILGAHSYLREGPTAIFQKLLRDVQAISVVHISRAACRMTLMPQLPLLAKRSWGQGSIPAESLFVASADLSPLDFSRLRVTGNGQDHLLGGLSVQVTDLADAGDPVIESIQRHVELLEEQVCDLRTTCIALRTAELGVEASPSAAAAVDRYVRLSSAAVCLQMWHQNRDSAGGWISDWAAAALAKLAGSRLSGAVGTGVEERLFDELLTRCALDRDLTITRTPIFTGAGDLLSGKTRME
jgi:alkylation response protein AidB-like acyl-CoA dehydrogenase